MSKQLLNNIDDFKEQIRNVKSLNEFVSRSTVVDAINGKDVVFIYYSGDETINRGYRTIEPFCLGVSTANNLVLRAWQQKGGATDSGVNPTRENDKIPGWRLFRLDGVTSMSKTLRKFDGKRPNYNPQDRQMTQIIAAVQPAAIDQPQVSGDTKTTPHTYQGMTNDKGWFRNQLDKFRNNFLNKKQQPDQNQAASKNWFNQQKGDFVNKMNKSKETDGRV